MQMTTVNMNGQKAERNEVYKTNSEAGSTES